MTRVSNYTQGNDWNPFGNNGRGTYGIKEAPCKFAKRKLARLIKGATEFMDGYSLDLSQYDPPDVVFSDMITAAVEWTHKVSGQKLVLTQIHFDEKTGEVIAAGSNYGELTL